MEDALVQRCCREVARQILMPSRHLAQPPSPAGTRQGNRASASPSTELTASLQRMSETVEAVVTRAMTLYRLCRSPQHGIVIAPTATASSSSSSFATSGGGGGAGHGGGGTGAAGDAAFCVCASLALLQPHVWESLSWRAAVIRPRSPRLMLGLPHPVPFAMKELNNFIARSARVLSSPFARGQAMKGGGGGGGGDSAASAPSALSTRIASLASVGAAALLPSAGSLSHSEAIVVPSTSRTRNAVAPLASSAPAMMDEVRAESVAACYFFSVTTPEERRRHEHIFRVSVEAREGRRERRESERLARTKAEEKTSKDHRGRDMYVEASGDGDGQGREPRRGDATGGRQCGTLASTPTASPHVAAAAGWPASLTPWVSPRWGAAGGAFALPLHVDSTAVGNLCVAEVQRQKGLLGRRHVGGSGGGGQGHVLFAEEGDLSGAGAGNDSDDRQRSGDDDDFGATAGGEGGEDGDGDANLRMDEEGGRKRRRPRSGHVGVRQAKQQHRQGREKGKPSSADPEVMWAKLCAAALGEETGGDGSSGNNSDDGGEGCVYGSASSLLRRGGPHRRLEGTPAADGWQPSLFTSTKPIHLVELAADVEMARRRLHWHRLATCLSNPLLFHGELLSRGQTCFSRSPAASLSPTSSGGPQRDGKRIDKDAAVALHRLHGALGSHYTSQCQLVCEQVGESSSVDALTSTLLQPQQRLLQSPVRCHPAHFLHPARAASLRPSAASPGLLTPSLLTAPLSVVTGNFLWTRLLVCAAWLTAYADYILPAAMPDSDSSEECGKANSGGGKEERKRDGEEHFKGKSTHPTASPDEEVDGERTGAETLPSLERRHARRCARAQLASQLLSPTVTATLAYCVSVAKEALQYGSICCPVCDSLSPAVTRQQQQWEEQQQQHQQQQQLKRGGDACPSAGGGPTEDSFGVRLATTATPVIQWATLREDRKALARAMQPFLTLAEKEEAEAFQDIRETVVRDAEEEEEMLERGLDSAERFLRRRWHCFECARSLQEALGAFAHADGGRGSGEEAAQPEGEQEPPGAVSVTQESRDVFLQALSRRLDSLVELLSGAFAASTPTLLGASSSTLNQPSHEVAADTSAGAGKRGKRAGLSAHDQRVQQQLRHATWVLRSLGVAPRAAGGAVVRDSATGEANVKKRWDCQGDGCRHESNLGTLRALQTASLREVVQQVLFGGQSVRLWGPLLFPLPAASDGERAGGEGRRDDGTAVRAGDATSTSATGGGQRGTCSPNPPPGQQQQQQRRRQRHRLKAQRKSLHALLDAIPFVPVLSEGDAVLECAHCFSFFHQACVGPVQSDLAGGVFLCHTCRLTHGDGAGLKVSPCPSSDLSPALCA